MLTLEGKLLEHSTAAASVRKDGSSLPQGDATARVEIKGHEDSRLHIAAKQLANAASSQLVTINDRTYLPISLNGKTPIGLDIEDLQTRFHWSKEKLESCLQSQENLEGMLHRRTNFPTVLDTYWVLVNAYNVESTKHPDDTPDNATCVRIWDKYDECDIDKRRLLKIVRKATRGLLSNPSGHWFKVDSHSILVSRDETGIPQLSLWSGQINPSRIYRQFMATGAYVTVQAIFRLNVWTGEALKTVFCEGNPEMIRDHPYKSWQSEQEIGKRLGADGISFHNKEVEILRAIASSGIVPKAIIAAPGHVLDFEYADEHLVGAIWQRYPCDLMDMIECSQSQEELTALSRGGLEHRTRLELLVFAAELFEALSFLEETGKVVNGDGKPANILCYEDEDGNLHPVACDWGGSLKETDYDFLNTGHCKDNLTMAMGGSFTPSYMSSSDAMQLTTLAREIQLLQSQEGNEELLQEKTKQYLQIQHGRDTLAYALTLYLTLGFAPTWRERVDDGYANLKLSFGRCLPQSERPEDIKTRIGFYGEEIHEMFESLLVERSENRMSPKKAAQVIRKVLEDAKRYPNGPLAKTLAQKRPEHNVC